MSVYPWLLLIGALLLYWWHSGRYKGLARHYAGRHCDEHALQLLDQSVVIRALWPLRGADGRLRWRRRYSFEFSSTGEARYQGTVTLMDSALHSIELEAYRIPDSG